MPVVKFITDIDY